MNRRRGLILSICLLVGLCLCGCMRVDDSSMKPSATPVPTNTPTIAPTNTPTPSPSPSVTPIPEFDITLMVDGGANACAKWDENGKLVETAEVVPGAMIYCNNIERHDGNRFPKDNVFAGAELLLNDRISQTGMFCMKVATRKETTRGVSGAGIMLNAVNGLDYKSLVGHTIELKFYLYYEDEGFGAPEQLTIALYDTYHTELVMGFTYDRNNELIVDSNGEPVLEEQEAFVVSGTQTVPRRTWTECVFRHKVTETDAKEGMLLIGTQGEVQNAVGMYAAYYIDDITITVVE